MRLHLGAIPNSLDFEPGESWRALREPTPLVAQLISVPIGVVTAAFIAFLWLLMTPVEDAPAFEPWAILLSFALIVVVHELIHAAVHPMAGHSPRSTIGFWPSRLLFYAHYDGELTRNRFVAILVAPLVVLSIAPLLIAAFAQLGSTWVAFVSVFNALLASLDALGAAMILLQIPGTAIVRNQGWRTYWRASGAR